MDMLRIGLRVFGVAFGIMFAIGAGVAAADSSKPAVADVTFGSRTDKPDGSASMTMGRRLPTEWDTKIGTDVSLAAPASTVPADNLMRGTAADRSTGAVWGNITTPVLRPLGFDKTSIDARLDAGSDQGKVGATLSRSMPINSDISVTLQNDYAVTQSLDSGAIEAPTIPLMTMPTASADTGTSLGPVWSAGETVRLNVLPYGTTISAGTGSSTVDSQWHNKLSLEQTLLGPLKVTTSVEDAGSAASRKSITAGFKRVW
jgi:hypothetical protein